MKASYDKNERRTSPFMAGRDQELAFSQLGLGMASLIYEP
jgi:hypothetical protein